MWKTSELTDRSQILAYLETDRLYAGYAIGDLEPGMFEQSTWAGAEEGNRLQALALYFRGLDPPALFLMGDTDGLRTILEDALCPEWVYLTCRTDLVSMVRHFYAWDEMIPMWRMALRPECFRPVNGDCTRLVPAHSNQLTALYALGGGAAFSPAQMERGVFYGAYVDGQLVAAAGTHLVSPTYGVAAVGNVFTRVGQGLAGYDLVTRWLRKTVTGVTLECAIR